MKHIRIKSIVIFAVLVALVAATRSHHFDSLTHLPDASLAAFLLAGIFLPVAAFPILLLVAGLSDYFAFNYAGVSDWCFSPAYWFLIPTYAVMWYAGRFYKARHSMTWQGLSLFAGTSMLATSAAFLISSGSFFLFSGRFADMSALEYAASVAKYYPQYLIGALAYLAVAAVVQVAAVKVSAHSAHA